MEGGLQTYSICLYGSSASGTWRCKRRLWVWAPHSMGVLLGKLGEGSHAVGLCVEEGLETGVSPYRRPIGGPWEGVHLWGTLRDG